MADLFWIMVAGAGLIWAAVVGFALYATRCDPDRHREAHGDALIVLGGVAAPAIVLGALLIYGLMAMPELRASGDGPRIHVAGEQWWWRVAYRMPGGGFVESANEVRLPVGARAELRLTSPDVIHSFWVPSLAGKVDMIPGRETRLVLEPTRTGTFRGVCAEFCGTSHAYMMFAVVVMEREAYGAWLTRQSAPAARATTDAALRGEKVFLESGCGACHTVRGTVAEGRLGPDLTHIGGRLTIAAGVLANSKQALTRWISDPKHIKPGARMPGFAFLEDADREAVATYLMGLK